MCCYQWYIGGLNIEDKRRICGDWNDNIGNVSERGLTLASSFDELPRRVRKLHPFSTVWPAFRHIFHTCINSHLRVLQLQHKANKNKKSKEKHKTRVKEKRYQQNARPTATHKKAGNENNQQFDTMKRRRLT